MELSRNSRGLEVKVRRQMSIACGSRRDVQVVSGMFRPLEYCIL